MGVGDKYRSNAENTAILMDVGIDLMRQNIRRTHPAMIEEQVDDLLSAWLYRTDEPIPGDTAGSVRVRDRAK